MVVVVVVVVVVVAAATTTAAVVVVASVVLLLSAGARALRLHRRRRRHRLSGSISSISSRSHSSINSHSNRISKTNTRSHGNTSQMDTCARYAAHPDTISWTAHRRTSVGAVAMHLDTCRKGTSAKCARFPVIISTTAQSDVRALRCRRSKLQPAELLVLLLVLLVAVTAAVPVSEVLP
jgi:hypothetical protein